MAHTLTMIQAGIVDAEKRQATEQRVKVCVGDLKEVMFDIEDLLDDYSTEKRIRYMMTRNNKANEVRIFFSRSNQLKYRYQMANRVQNLRERLDAIKADFVSFHFAPHPSSLEIPFVKRPLDRETDSYILENEVIGREEEQKRLIKLLLKTNEEDANILVIPVVGMGGLGKTTLAKLVYNNQDIHKHFELKFWVCVSDEFDVIKVSQKIIESNSNSLSKDEALGKLRNKVGGKKFLLVLDDVWEDNTDKIWDDLRMSLMGGQKGSKIIVTTRKQTVARIMGTSSPFDLKGLDEKKSWELLRQRVFDKGQVLDDSELIKIGEEIARKCGGIPLVIRTIARLLRFDVSRQNWMNFNENGLSRIIQDDDDVISTLKLSYDSLPLHLKKCFAYCSIFPKDYKIEVETLIQMWIAHEFIQERGRNCTLEVMGREYFLELMWGSFFQDIEEDEFGEVVSCKMHDFMHDLAMLVVGDDVYDANENRKGEETAAAATTEILRRIKSKLLLSNAWLRANRRTLVCVRAILRREVKNIISSFEFLRVLRLSVGSSPNSIGKLKHLRYLDLSYSGIEILPSSITKLQNLQTLKLNYCLNLKQLPDDIRRLVQLRHLDLIECLNLTHMPRGLGELTSLQTLTRFQLCSYNYKVASGCGRINELKELNSLRGDIEIIGLEHLRYNHMWEAAKSARLHDKQHLQSLKLRWDYRARDDSDIVADADRMILEGIKPHSEIKSIWIGYYMGATLPDWISDTAYSNLVLLQIFECSRLQHLPALHQLNHLQVIELRHLNNLEYILDDNDDKRLLERGGGNANKYEDHHLNSSGYLFFPSLKNMTLQSLPKLMGWWRRYATNGDKEVEITTTDHKQQQLRHHPFPPCALEGLIIHDCPKLTSNFPLCPYVEALDLSNVSEKILEILSPFPGSKIKHVNKKQQQQRISLYGRSGEIKIYDMEDLERFPFGDKEEEEKGALIVTPLTSFTDLTISECPKLASLSGILQYLTALKNLEISDCPSLDLTFDGGEDYGTQWKHISSLQHLRLYRLPHVVSLPSGIQHLNTLKSLKIKSCENLESLPEWMRVLTSLERLIILAPHPSLIQRCQRQVGPDWPNIAHVRICRICSREDFQRLSYSEQLGYLYF